MDRRNMGDLPVELHRYIVGENITLMLKLSCVNRYFHRLFRPILIRWWQRYSLFDPRIKTWLTPHELSTVNMWLSSYNLQRSIPNICQKIIQFGRTHPTPHRFYIIVHNLQSIVEIVLSANTGILTVYLTGHLFLPSINISTKESQTEH